VNVIRVLLLFSVQALSTRVQAAGGSSTRFEDYPATGIFVGTPAMPRLTTKLQQSYRTQITEGVEKGWGVHKDGREQGKPGPNFAGHMIIVQWSSGAPGLGMAMVDAKTGEVYYPPISFSGVGAVSFDLPLLTPPRSVPQNPELQFRLNSRLLVIKATPKQTGPPSAYYFLWEANRWTLLKRLPVKAN
jgi:hypothetical protein